MPRNDNRTRAGDVFGKPGTSYPDGSLAHPTIVEEYTDQQESTRKAFLAAHPDTAVALLVEQREGPGDNTDMVLKEVFETLPGVLLAGVSMSDSAQGTLVHNSQQRLAVTEPDYSPSWRTLAYSDTPLDANRKKRTLVELGSGDSFPILTEYDQDPVLQYLIVTTYQIVEAAAITSPGTIVNGKITRFKKIDKWRSMKIVEDHTALLSLTYSEQRFDAANFPTLFDVDKFFWTDACGAFSRQRDGFSTMVQSVVDISFTATKQTITGLTLIPQSIHLGKNFNESNILINAGTYVFFGDCTGTATFEASSPSRTAYLALTGPQLITGESTLFRAGIYRNSKLYRTMI